MLAMRIQLAQPSYLVPAPFQRSPTSPQQWPSLAYQLFIILAVVAVTPASAAQPSWQLAPVSLSPSLLANVAQYLWPLLWRIYVFG